MASTSLITVSGNNNIIINIDSSENFIITKDQYNDIKNIIKNNFNDEEAIMFIENFFMYMKYGSDCQEFIVDFNDVWKWCDFSEKSNGKRFLIKKFKENEDYIIKDKVQSCENSIARTDEQDIIRNKYGAGHNIEYIYLKIDVFEQFCMLAGTEKAKRIRKFYIKMKDMFLRSLLRYKHIDKINNSIIKNNEKYVFNDNELEELKNIIKSRFNDEEFITFMNSFFVYLKYGNNYQEFIVPFDDVWKFCEFSRKSKAKELLVNKFKDNIDYIISVTAPFGAITENSHKLKCAENILLKINTFKKFCLIAGTSKAERIHDYYINMESLCFEFVISKLRNKDIIVNNEPIKSYINNIDFEKSQVYFINIGKKTNKDGFICKDKNNNIIEGNKTIIKYGRQGLKTGRQPVHIKKFENYNLLDSLFTNKPVELETYATRLSKMKGLWCKIEDPREYKGDEYLAIDSQGTYNNFIIDINEKCLEINNKLLIEDKSKDDNNIELKKLDIELKKEETKQLEIEAINKTKQEELKLKEEQEETKQCELKLKEKELDFKMMCIQNGLIHLIENKTKEEIPKIAKETEKVIKPIKTEKINNNQNTPIIQQKKKRNSKKSSYIGVTFIEPSKSSNRKTTTYSSRIYYNKKYYYLGTYNTIEEAAYAYNCKAFEFYGFECEILNDIDLSKTHEFDYIINRLILIQ